MALDRRMDSGGRNSIDNPSPLKIRPVIVKDLSMFGTPGDKAGRRPLKRKARGQSSSQRSLSRGYYQGSGSKLVNLTLKYPSYGRSRSRGRSSGGHGHMRRGSESSRECTSRSRLSSSGGISRNRSKSRSRKRHGSLGSRGPSASLERSKTAKRKSSNTRKAKSGSKTRKL
jgi:hypothetical protein